MKYYKMRLTFLIFALLAIAIIGILRITAINKTLSENNLTQSLLDQPEVMNIEVDISGQNIQPEELVVNKGDQVIFKNVDTVSHNIIGQDFESGPVNPGESYSRVFDRLGNFYYKLSSSELSGKIIVK